MDGQRRGSGDCVKLRRGGTDERFTDRTSRRGGRGQSDYRERMSAAGERGGSRHYRFRERDPGRRRCGNRFDAGGGEGLSMEDPLCPRKSFFQ